MKKKFSLDLTACIVILPACAYAVVLDISGTFRRGYAVEAAAEQLVLGDIEFQIKYLSFCVIFKGRIQG